MTQEETRRGKEVESQQQREKNDLPHRTSQFPSQVSLTQIN